MIDLSSKKKGTPYREHLRLLDKTLIEWIKEHAPYDASYDNALRALADGNITREERDKVFIDELSPFARHVINTAEVSANVYLDMRENELDGEEFFCEEYQKNEGKSTLFASELTAENIRVVSEAFGAIKDGAEAIVTIHNSHGEPIERKVSSFTATMVNQAALCALEVAAKKTGGTVLEKLETTPLHGR